MIVVALFCAAAAIPIDPPGVVNADAARAYDAAVAMRRERRFRAAAEAFEAVAREFPSSRRAPQALAAAGDLYLWQLDQPARAAQLFDRVIAGPDDVPGAMHALTQRLSLENKRSGAKGELALIHTLYEKRKTSELAPYLLLRASRLLDEELDQPLAALAPVQRVVESFALSSWADEATIRSARLLRRLGRAQDALREYRRLIATRSESFIIGEYDSDHLDEAYFEVAETYERDLKDLRAAEKAYLRLVDEMPESVRVDGALHRAERLALARGDKDSARRYRETLLRLKPGSRFLKAPRR